MRSVYISLLVVAAVKVFQIMRHRRDMIADEMKNLHLKMSGGYVRGNDGKWHWVTGHGRGENLLGG